MSRDFSETAQALQEVRLKLWRIVTAASRRLAQLALQLLALVAVGQRLLTGDDAALHQRCELGTHQAVAFLPRGLHRGHELGLVFPSRIRFAIA